MMMAADDGEFLKTEPGTQVTFGPDGVTFTAPDGTGRTEPYPPLRLGDIMTLDELRSFDEQAGHE
jgi:hypothetical protein